MFTIKLALVLFLMFCHVSYCNRRIEGGQVLTSQKTYVVYLVKASLSLRNYDSWLCGGALVTEDFVLTSAACVEDVNYLFVIAGYDKYVPDKEIDENECTKTMKKKVIYTCVPVSYNFEFDKLENWAHIDIALAKVESPYDFSDENFITLCSYIPTIIPINYDSKYQATNTDALVMGWGHAKIWRKHHDTKNHNSETLHYASTLIMDKSECKKHYEYYPSMFPIIDQYMICTLEAGNIDDQGNPIEKSELPEDGCGPDAVKLNGQCEPILVDPTRREIKTPRKKHNYTTYYGYIKGAAQKKNTTFANTRRNGICQNDHGGPLVTWVGKREVVIGVASVFKVTENSECIGPFLYTSTKCNGAFLDCVLNNPSPYIRGGNATALALCDSQPNVKGYDTIENYISWADHPAGPAQSEFQKPDTVTNAEQGNKNVAKQVSHASNERPAENNMYQNQERIRDNNNFAGQMQNMANKYKENERYVGSANYGPIEKFQNIYMYGSNQRIPNNDMYATNQRITNNMYPPRERPPNDDIIVMESNTGDSGPLMRPQRPFHL